MKYLLPGLLFLLFCDDALCQDIMASDMAMSKTMRVSDTLELKFLSWPGPGLQWYPDSKNDTSCISIKFKSSELMEGNHPKGGQYLITNLFIGKKPGKVTLQFYWGRTWLQEKLHTCRIEMVIHEKSRP